MLNMQFMTWMVNIIRGLSFLITIKSGGDLMVVIVDMENMPVVAAVIVVELIPLIAGVQPSFPISLPL